MTPPDDPTPPREYPIVTDATPWRNVSPEARRAALEDAFARALEFVDPAQHHLMRMYIMGEGLPGGTHVGIGGAFHPEMARLLGIISSIRAAERPSPAPIEGWSDEDEEEGIA